MSPLYQSVPPLRRDPGHPRLNRPQPDDEMNLSHRDRIVAGVLGGAMVLNGFVKRRPMPLLLAAAGAELFLWGLRGRSPLHALFGIQSARNGTARPRDYFEYSIHLDVKFPVALPAGELFRLWRNFENLPRFMRHLQSVRRLDDRRSRWSVHGPAGAVLQWDAEIINEEPDRLISWRSIGPADVDNAGTVRFLPLETGRGAEVHVVIDYIPPAGRIGSAVAWLFGEAPRRQIETDLRSFRQFAESRIGAF